MIGLYQSLSHRCFYEMVLLGLIDGILKRKNFLEGVVPRIIFLF